MIHKFLSRGVSYVLTTLGDKKLHYSMRWEQFGGVFATRGFLIWRNQSGEKLRMFGPLKSSGMMDQDIISYHKALRGFAKTLWNIVSKLS